jgi:hypothetical protein
MMPSSIFEVERRPTMRAADRALRWTHGSDLTALWAFRRRIQGTRFTIADELPQFDEHGREVEIVESHS